MSACSRLGSRWSETIRNRHYLRQKLTIAVTNEMGVLSYVYYTSRQYHTKNITKCAISTWIKISISYDKKKNKNKKKPFCSQEKHHKLFFAND